MKLLAARIWLLLCTTAPAWNPTHTIDPADTNALRSAGVQIRYTEWHHADSTTSHYWFHIVIDGSALPAPTQLYATAALRREADRNKWDVKVAGAPTGTNANHVLLTFEVTDEFIINSVIQIQKTKAGRGVGGYRLLLSDIVATPFLSSLHQDQNAHERDNNGIQPTK